MMTPIKILVTEREHTKAKVFFNALREKGLCCLPAPSTEEDLAKAVSEHHARHVVVGVERYRGALYEALAPGGVIARFGVGYDGLDLVRATRAGILCINTPGVLDRSVAEHTLMLIMAAARRLPEMHDAVRKGDWPSVAGTELQGRNLAIIGAGAIGSQVARMASFGFGMRVTGCDTRELDEARMKTEYGFTAIVRDFRPALAQADFVSLHVPALPATRHLINAGTLAAMSPQAWLINTSRGILIDESALFEALKTGIIAGAALDVFENEPYLPVQPDKDFRTLKNIIMTPHAAGGTTETLRRATDKVMDNILAAEQKQFDRMALLNPEVIPSLTI